jgi:hypothetical protein
MLERERPVSSITATSRSSFDIYFPAQKWSEIVDCLYPNGEDPIFRFQLTISVDTH